MRKILIIFIVQNDCNSIECLTDLDSLGEMIIFESNLTTFKLSIVFRGSLNSSENWLEPKTKPP